jgi:hypothetical protein
MSLADAPGIPRAIRYEQMDVDGKIDAAAWLLDKARPTNRTSCGARHSLQ